VSCGQSLIVVCPRCYTINAITAEQCLACELPIDMLGQIMARNEVRFEDRFTRQAAIASDAKTEQHKSDQTHSQQLWEKERQRQQYLLTQKRRQRQQERLLILGAAAVAALIIVIVVMASVAH
jgi:hypothetical protein